MNNEEKCWLGHFPRPPEDTGRGVHAHPDPHPLGFFQYWDYWAEELQQMGIRWVKIIDPGDGVGLHLAEKLIGIGVMPVVRFYEERRYPGRIKADREIRTAADYVSIGAVYFEANNEPDLALEWKDGKMPEDWLDVVVDSFIWGADRIREVGGYLLFPAFGPGGRGNPFKMLVDRGRRDLLDGNMCLAIHNYCLGRPLDYPEDPVTRRGASITYEEWLAAGEGVRSMDTPFDKAFHAWEMTERTVNQWRLDLANPEASILDDSTCFRAYEYFDFLVNDACGHSIPILTTEGGYNVWQRAGTTWGDDPRWPKPTPQAVGELTLAMFKRIEEGPAYYFASMPWLLAVKAMGSWQLGFEMQGPWYSHAFKHFDGCDDGKLPVVGLLKEHPGEIREEGPQSEHWGEPIGEREDIIMPNEFDQVREWLLENPTPDAGLLEYGVNLSRATVAEGQVYFKAVGVWHLLPEENNGRHNVFIQVVDEKGEPLDGTEVSWVWDGIGPEEKEPNPVIIGDKPPNETDNFALQANFSGVSVWVSTPFYLTDIVNGLRSTHPDEPDGNAVGHHSFYLLFQLTTVEEGEDPEPEPEPEPDDRLRELARSISQVGWGLVDLAAEYGYEEGH